MSVWVGNTSYKHGKMLWQKEQLRDSEAYTELWNTIPRNYLRRHIDTNSTSGKPRKSDKKSQKFRKISFDCMKRRNYSLAIEWLNKSICYAPSDSNGAHISYAHRSECFYHLKAYSACVKDIEMAKNGSSMNVAMLAELNQRERSCQSLLEQLQPNQTIKPSNLIYNNYNSDQLEFTTSASTLRPNRDINVGETMCVEEPFCSVLVNQVYSRCATCFQSQLNLMPCGRCTKAMFCSVHCQTFGIHEKCCSVIWASQPTGNQMLILCTVLVVFELFPSLAHLIDTIETFNLDVNLAPMQCNRMTLKYRQFFEACHRDEYTCNDFVRSIVNSLPIFYAIVKHRTHGRQFESEESQRFLIHLIAHHWQFIEKNLHTTLHAPSNPINLKSMRVRTTPYAKAVCFTKLTLKHSCVPNVQPINVGTNVIYKAIRPINTDEHLSISYVVLLAYFFAVLRIATQITKLPFFISDIAMYYMTDHGLVSSAFAC